MCWHNWSKWKQYQTSYSYQPALFNKANQTFQASDVRQQRKCFDCGKIQDELVGNTTTQILHEDVFSWDDRQPMEK